MRASAEVRARWLFTGVLLLAALAAAGWLALDSLRDATYEIRTHDAVSGLLPGAPVEFHGVEVGKVRSVELLAPRLVRVLVQVRRDVPVTSATVATITGRGMATRGFTGYVYVSLEEGGGPARPLARAQGSEHPLLASAPSRIVSLDTTMSDLNRNVQQVTGTLQAALDPATLATLKQSLADLQVVTHTLAENNARMERILANAERASVQAQGTLARIDGVATATDARLGTILRNTEQASARIEPLLQAGNDALYALQVQLIPETQRTLARLDQLSTSLGDTAARVRRNPALLVRGTAPAAAGPGEGP